MSDQKGNIGLEYLNALYNRVELVTENPQPLFIIHRDTVKSFLHEKRGVLCLPDRLFSLVGIEIALLVPILTATFSAIWGIDAGTIKGIFVGFALLITVWLIVTLGKIIEKRKELTVEQLCSDLGKRGTVVQPEPKPDHTDVTAGRSGAKTVSSQS